MSDPTLSDIDFEKFNGLYLDHLKSRLGFPEQNGSKWFFSNLRVSKLLTFEFSKCLNLKYRLMLVKYARQETFFQKRIFLFIKPKP